MELELKPFLKWVGGKTQILENIYDKFPNKIDNYYEPFIGGGSVFLKLIEKCEKKEITVKNFYLNDKNQNLINLYINIKNNINNLIDELEILKNNYNNVKSIKYEPRHKCKFNEDDTYNTIKEKGKLYVYYFYRYQYNQLEIDNTLKSALFLFLNKTCFRGLYREGNNKFNVPFGNYENPNIFNKEYLLKLNKLFTKYNLNFSHENFNEIKFNFNKNNFIFLDPPYYPINNTSFVDYQKSGFTDKENDDLLSICNNFNDKKIKFIHCNSNSPYNLTNYEKYNIEHILCKRKINSKNPKSTELELIITNF